MKTSKDKILDFTFFTLILLWCIGFLWNIVIQYFPNLAVALPFLKYNYSLVCHQQPEKLLTVGNHTTLVCSRCAGIYFGALFSSALVLLGVIKNISTKFFLILSMPLLIDVILYSSGLYNYSKTIALVTGLLLGSAGFIYIQDALKIIFAKNNKE